MHPPPGPVELGHPAAGGARDRVRGLDGVRALAVLAVIAFHTGLPIAPGGFLGVDVFFVLSGYLITDLLVTQQERYGRLRLRTFWVRRAKRLLPALAVVLVTVTAAVAVLEPGQLSALRPALASALTYSSNWYETLRHVSYFDSFGPPPPLEHLWSLAIEEQFYLVWPLVLAVILTRIGTRRSRALIAWVGALASALVMALLYLPGGDPSRVYYGTDTHAAALLIGAALALTWPLARLVSARGRFARRLDYAGVAGLAVLAWAVGHFSGTDPTLYPFGLILAALGAAALVLAAAVPGVVASLLTRPALRWVGVRSYGIYLWHWPVIALAQACGAKPGSPWVWLAGPVLAVTFAAMSWKWLEEPILRNGFRATCTRLYQAVSASATAAWKSPARAMPAGFAMAALTVACTAGYGVINPPPPSSSGLQRQIARGERVSAATRSRPQPALSPAPVPSPVPDPVPTSAAPGHPIAGSAITAIGDSVMAAAAVQLRTALPGIYIDARVSRQMAAGLTLVRRLASSGRLRRVLVLGLGTNGTVSSSQLRQLLRVIGPSRALVLVSTYERRPWEHEVNTTFGAAARRYRNVVLANWTKAIEHRTGLLWPDGVHPRPPGARVYARVIARAVQAVGAVTRPAPDGVATPSASSPR